jgi:hypothetical protein
LSRLLSKAWAKGSARNTGPAKATGTVRVPDAAEVRGMFRDLNPPCACGKRQLRCDDCAGWYCNDPGHALHVCLTDPLRPACPERDGKARCQFSAGNPPHCVFCGSGVLP